MMTTMRELIKDPTYRAFLTTSPATPTLHRDKTRMKSGSWVVYVQMEAKGNWTRRTFWKYTKAFKYLKSKLAEGCHDATINNKRFPTPPPGRVVRIKGKYVMGKDGVRRQVTKWVPWKLAEVPGEDAHHWCLYCRRPTIFKFYRRHPALGGEVDPDVARCCICGASTRIALHHTDKLYRRH